MNKNLEEQYMKIWARIVVKAWSDPRFKKRLIQSPKEALRENGLQIAQDKTVVILDSHDKMRKDPSGKIVYLQIPAQTQELSDEQIKAIAGGGIDMTWRWSDFQTGFMSVIKPAAQVLMTVAPLLL